MNVIRRLCKSVLLVVIACTCQACTVGMWSNALQPAWRAREVGRVVVDEGGPVAVMVEYHRWQFIAEDTRFARVPVDAELRPIGLPYRQLGATSGPVKIDFEPHERQAVAGLRLELTDQSKLAAGERLEQLSSRCRVHREEGTAALVYWPAGVRPKDARPIVLLVPAEQPRPAVDRIGSVVVATIVTPVTLVGDAILLPPALLLAMAWQAEMNTGQ